MYQRGCERLCWEGREATVKQIFVDAAIKCACGAGEKKGTSASGRVPLDGLAVAKGPTWTPPLAS